MKPLLLWFALAASVTHAQNHHLALVGSWDNSAVTPAQGYRYNDLWGWHQQSKGRLYAILASTDSIFFIEVTNPAKPERRDAKAGRSKGCINRDIETSGKYLYAVADQGAASLQIFDLSYLPDSVHTVYDEDSLCQTAHTLTVNVDRLYLCKNKANKTGGIVPLQVFSIANQQVPVVLGGLQAPLIGGKPAFEYVHDVAVRNDTAWCSCGDGGLWVYDLTHSFNPTYIGSLTTYAEQGFNHSSSLSQDGKWLYFTDETVGKAIKVTDISDPKQPDVSLLFRTNTGAVAHNTYVQGNRLWISAYHDGVVCYDISKPGQPTEIARYDTYPQNAAGDYPGLAGCWAVYTALPGGIVLASDTRNGLLVLRDEIHTGIGQPSGQKQLKYEVITDVQGRYIAYGISTTAEIGITPGIYLRLQYWQDGSVTVTKLCNVAGR